MYEESVCSTLGGASLAALWVGGRVPSILFFWGGGTVWVSGFKFLLRLIGHG